MNGWLGQRRPIRHTAPRHFFAGDVHDDRIVRRSPFDLKNPGDGPRVQRIGSEAVNGFSGQRDQFTGAEQLRCARHGGVEQRRRVRR